MIDGTYEVLIKGRRGTVVLETAEGGVLLASVKFPGLPRQKGAGTYEGDTFKADGAVKIPVVGAFEYELVGSVQEDLLEASCKTSRGSFQVAGVRV